MCSQFFTCGACYRSVYSNHHSQREVGIQDAEFSVSPTHLQCAVNVLVDVVHTYQQND
jgi:hypothetical protein